MTRIIGVSVMWMFVVSCAAGHKAEPMSAPSGPVYAESAPAPDMAPAEGADYDDAAPMEMVMAEEDAEYEAPAPSAAPPPMAMALRASVFAA